MKPILYCEEYIKMNTIKDLLFALILLLAGVVCTLLMQFTSFEIAGIGGVIFPLIGLVFAFYSYFKRTDRN